MIPRTMPPSPETDHPPQKTADGGGSNNKSILQSLSANLHDSMKQVATNVSSPRSNDFDLKLTVETEAADGEEDQPSNRQHVDDVADVAGLDRRVGGLMTTQSPVITTPRVSNASTPVRGSKSEIPSPKGQLPSPDSFTRSNTILDESQDQSSPTNVSADGQTTAGRASPNSKRGRPPRRPSPSSTTPSVRDLLASTVLGPCSPTEVWRDMTGGGGGGESSSGASARSRFKSSPLRESLNESLHDWNENLTDGVMDGVEFVRSMSLPEKFREVAGGVRGSVLSCVSPKGVFVDEGCVPGDGEAEEEHPRRHLHRSGEAAASPVTPGMFESSGSIDAPPPPPTGSQNKNADRGKDDLNQYIDRSINNKSANSADHPQGQQHQQQPPPPTPRPASSLSHTPYEIAALPTGDDADQQTVDTAAEEELEDEMYHLARMTSWNTIDSRSVLSVGTTGTTGTMGTVNTVSTAGTYETEGTFGDDVSAAQKKSGGVMNMLGLGSSDVPEVKRVVDDDGNEIPDDVLQEVHRRRKHRSKSRSKGRSSKKSHSGSGRRRQKAVQFEYPPISSLRECPRITDPNEKDALFFTEEELDQIEDDRVGCRMADDIEIVAVDKIAGGGGSQQAGGKKQEEESKGTGVKKLSKRAARKANLAKAKAKAEASATKASSAATAGSSSMTPPPSPVQTEESSNESHQNNTIAATGAGSQERNGRVGIAAEAYDPPTPLRRGNKKEAKKGERSSTPIPRGFADYDAQDEIDDGGDAANDNNNNSGLPPPLSPTRSPYPPSPRDTPTRSHRGTGRGRNLLMSRSGGGRSPTAPPSPSKTSSFKENAATGAVDSPNAAAAASPSNKNGEGGKKTQMLQGVQIYLRQRSTSYKKRPEYEY